MKKITVSILLLVAVFFSFIPVIIGKYQENLNENNHSVTIVLDAGHGEKMGELRQQVELLKKKLSYLLQKR